LLPILNLFSAHTTFKPHALSSLNPLFSSCFYSFLFLPSCQRTSYLLM
jgi:hypothetical protein